jgi:predicted enzyme related to lactoylglutathione lyase
MPAYAPGTPCWVELSSPDADASAAFYGALMDWIATEAGPLEETGGYRMFQHEGRNVAGLMRHMQEGQPTAWSTYVSVRDADESAEKVRAAGGDVLVEPMDVMELGRMGFFADPAGAAFGVWEPRGFSGADLVNEPNSLCWNELATRDVEASRGFYPAVFGWAAGRPGFEAPESYTVWQLDGRPVGGMREMPSDVPPHVPAHWGVCFAVGDCDAVVARAAELGATTVVEPTNIPVGRFAGIVDPQGAGFAVMRLAPPA